jgi:hypothetical protein
MCFYSEWHLYRQLHTHSWVKTHVSRLLISTNNIEWHLHRQLHTRSGVNTHVIFLLTSTNNIEWHLVLVRSRVTCVFLRNECVIVYTGVILCCSCSLGSVVHVFLLMNECVIVYATSVPRLLTIRNNIEWHLNRQLHTRSWIKTFVPQGSFYVVRAR